MATTLPTTEQAATDLRDWEAACERIHQMGHAVERKRIPFFETRDWDAEDVMNVWAGKYTRNIAIHYQDILRDPHIGPLEGIMRGQHPVAVVGAGPSLDKNAEALADFPGLIIASDRAAKALTARGIPPDIVVCVDPRLVVMAEMVDYPQNARQTLVLSVCCDPEVARVWRGRRLYFSTAHEGTQFHDRILPELFPGMPALFATGNVGNTSVQLAHWIQAGKVVLVGHDYGYTGGRMHCDDWRWEPHRDVDPQREWTSISRGSWGRHHVDHADKLALRSGKIDVDGVQTYKAFVEYRESLKQIVEVMKVDLVNATEGGILNCFPQAPLATVIKDLRSQNHDAGEARALLAQAIGGTP